MSEMPGPRAAKNNTPWKWLTVFVCAAIALVALRYISSPSVAILVTLAAVTFGLLTLATVAKGRMANLMLAAAGIAFGLIFVEIACLPFTKTVTETGKAELFAKDETLGWVLRPGRHRVIKTVNGKVIYDALYGIDEKSHRITKTAETGPLFGFLGDSVTFGEGVADQDTFPQSFSDLMDGKGRVVNIGVSAYSPAQVLRELQLGRYDDVLKPAKTLVFLTAPWHTDRTACRVAFVEGAPRYVLRDGKVVLDGVCAKPSHSAIMATLMGTATYRVLVEPRRGLVDRADILTYIAIISEAAKVARETYGATLVVPYMRNPGYLHFTGITDDEIILRLREGGADAFDGTVPNEGRGNVAIAGDGHPTGLGHRLRAKLLLDHLKHEKASLF